MAIDPVQLALLTAKKATPVSNKVGAGSVSTPPIVKPSLNLNQGGLQAVSTAMNTANTINNTPKPVITPEKIPQTGSFELGELSPDEVAFAKKAKQAGYSLEDTKTSIAKRRGVATPTTTQNIAGGLVQKSNKVMDFLSQVAQPFKTVGEGLAGLTTKAGEYLDPDTYNPAIQAVNTARMGAGLVDGSIKPRSEAENRYMDKSVSQNVLDTAEGTTYLASQIYAPITSAVFQLGAEIPGVRNVLGSVGEGFTRVGEKLKYVPGYRQYRDLLPPEDQQRLDSFAGNMIATFAGTTGKKNLTQGKLKDYVIENFGSPGDIDRAFGRQIKSGAEATIAGTKTLYNKIPNPIESIARKITGTADDYGKLFKSAEPRTNQLNKAVDYKNLQKNHNIASEEIVKAGYKPVDTASRAEAHANTMKKIRKEEIESKIGNNFRINLNPVADKIDEFVSKQKTAGLLKNEGQLAELKAQADKFRKMGEVDGADGEFIKEMLNSQVNNRGDASLGDVYKNGLKEATKTLGQSLDDTFSSIPGQFSEAKRRFGALKATYQDIVKADIKAQKAKGLGIGETFGRIEGIGDIAGAIGGLVTGKNPLPQLASGFGKLAVGKVLAKIKDKDFLIQEGFEGLSKKIPVANTINISKKGTQLGLPLLKQTAKAPTAITPGGVIKQTPTPPKLTPKTPPITVEKGAIGMGTPKVNNTPVITPKPTVAPSVSAPKIDTFKRLTELDTDPNFKKQSLKETNYGRNAKGLETEYGTVEKVNVNNRYDPISYTIKGKDYPTSEVKDFWKKQTPDELAAAKVDRINSDAATELRSIENSPTTKTYGSNLRGILDELGIKKVSDIPEGAEAEVLKMVRARSAPKVATPPAPKGFKGLGKETMEQNISKADDSLIQEAKKYKSAEEFVNKQGKPLYHGTHNNFKSLDINKAGTTNDYGVWGEGLYLTPHLETAKNYGKNIHKLYGTPKNPLDVSRFGRIKDAADYLDMSEDALRMDSDGSIRPLASQAQQFSSHVKDLGHDGIVKYRDKSTEYVLFDTKNIKTESQLKQIREQANKKTLPPLPKKGK